MGPILDPSWAHLGPILGPSWAYLGLILGLSWAILGPSGPILIHLGPILGHLGLSWGHLGTHQVSVRLFSEAEDDSFTCFWFLTLFLRSWTMWSLSLRSFHHSVLCSLSSLGVLRPSAPNPRASSFDHGLCGRCPLASATRPGGMREAIE